MDGRLKKFAVLNNKGGIGKSTIAVHVAHGLAIKGKKVLLIDMDGQNDASLFLGFTSEDYKKSFYNIAVENERVSLFECIIHARENLDLLPSRRIDLINLELYKEHNISSYLFNKLKEVESSAYDYVIIDCGPQRSRINDAALYYVDKIIVPVQVEAASVRAIGNIYEYLSDLGLDSTMISLVVPNMYDERTSDSKENLEFVKEFFSGSDVLTEPIYRRVKITETGKLGRTVYESDREAARQFDHIVERLVNIDGNKRQ
ncbi:ParA family protein [Ruminiclostridium herbifermentans]|uniref:ParA family protein n=1 Tax=Ruminiclostridium herbifermentans TaxID=2488810 RepID=A0A4U7JJ98_9FIRM|nr:ParA family protein [Ruminiclostridium herbifermentans]QNU66126.1 ParA family protein [Ruminiclostridium herbifermentans]